MSRRDFFARVTGRPAAEPGAGSGTGDPEEGEDRDGVLYSFHVAAFPFHDGPVLVPTLREGMTFTLAPDDEHFTDPHAVRISHGRQHLGYVPADRSADVRDRLARAEPLECRAARVDPSADLARVLLVEIRRTVGEAGEGAAQDA